MATRLISHLLALLALNLPQRSLGEESEECKDHPGGCRCYYDALAFGCPTSLGHDMRQFLCKCSYGDNTWFNVMTNFIWAFRTPPAERSMLTQKFGVRIEAGGMLSMDVGYTQRIQCGAAMAAVYPGTNFELDVQELYQLAGNLFSAEVHNKMNELCVPGRIALQLLCLHAELGRLNAEGAKAYAKQLKRVWPMVEPCMERSTPWTFPGLSAYLDVWKNAKVPDDGSSLSMDVALGLSWWPDRDALRGKLPEESENHYWPCAPLQDRNCFPAGTNSLHMSCEHCCDPGKGPTGEGACFVGEFTFARCCRTPGGSGRFY